MASKRLIDIIKYEDPSGKVLAHKEPQSGADIQYGAQLVVHQSQTAVFYKDGRALGTFDPGRHTLTTNNVPFLKDLIAKVTSGGQTPFTAEVVFVNTGSVVRGKWGTPTPIDFEDEKLGIVSLRAFGEYTIKIADPMLFVTNWVKTRGEVLEDDVTRDLKSAIMMHFNDLLGTQFKTYFKIRSNLVEFSGAMKFLLKEDFDKYGMEIRDFFISNVSVPEDVQEAFKERTKMGALGDMGTFMQYKTANAIGDMAAKPSGGGGDPMNAGMGLGMGMMMPQMMQNAMSGAMGGQPMGVSQQAQPPAGVATPQARMVACAGCQNPVAEGSKFCPNCGQSMAPPKVSCPHCGAQVVGGKFCGECGKSLESPGGVCPGCSAKLAQGARFCAECGTKV